MSTFIKSLTFNFYFTHWTASVSLLQTPSTERETHTDTFMCSSTSLRWLLIWKCWALCNCKHYIFYSALYVNVMHLEWNDLLCNGLYTLFYGAIKVVVCNNIATKVVNTLTHIQHHSLYIHTCAGFTFFYYRSTIFMKSTNKSSFYS